MYYDRPPEELIFLTRFEHMSLHTKGKHRSEETKAKISATLKGRPNHFKGKPLSEEHKVKLSVAHKGKKHSEETKAKMSTTRKGRYKGMHWKLVDGKRVWY